MRKKGDLAHEIHRTLEITYKSAWFLCHRIREGNRIALRVTAEARARKVLMGITGKRLIYWGVKRVKKGHDQPNSPMQLDFFELWKSQ